MHMSMGRDRMKLMRDARPAVLRAAAFSSSVAGTSPRIFFWFGQMKTHTLNSMMVPSQAPTPRGRKPGRLDDVEIVQETDPRDAGDDVQPPVQTAPVKTGTHSAGHAEPNADDDREHHTGRDGALDGIERMHVI